MLSGRERKALLRARRPSPRTYPSFQRKSRPREQAGPGFSLDLFGLQEMANPLEECHR